MKKLISVRKSTYKHLCLMLLIVLTFIGTFSVSEIEKSTEFRLFSYSNDTNIDSNSQGKLLVDTYGALSDEELNANTVSGLNPTATTVKLFDYNGGSVSEGISQNHALIFGAVSSQATYGAANIFTGNSSPRTGIVQNQLGADGYPVLNNAGRPGYNRNESLAYLFNDTAISTNNTKLVYPKANGLFQLDDDGYYYYDSRENYAYFNTDTGNVTLYNSPGGSFNGAGGRSYGQFLPFDSASKVFDTIDGKNLTYTGTGSVDNYFDTSSSSTQANLNFYFGMSMESQFVQPADGLIRKDTPMTFEFSGDDDLWIFIDGVLVGDVGGIHNATSLKIDFSTGEVYVNNALQKTIRQYYQDAHNTTSDEPGGVKFNGNTFAADTIHELKLFYLERGAGASNLSLKFNLQPSEYQQIKKVDQFGNPISGVQFELYEATETTDENEIRCTSTVNDGDIFVRKANDTVLATITTDENGIANIAEASGTPFGFADRSNRYYILHETSPASGYRNLPIDIVLEYNPDTTMISVANRWTTGSYASFTSYVYGKSDMRYGSYDTTTGFVTGSTTEVSLSSRQNGLVLAVPMLLDKNDKWMPLYGDNIDGFKTVGEVGSTASDMRKALLKAALLQTQYDTNWYLTWDSDLNRLEGTLTDLPGRADRYRHINDKGDMRMVYIIIEPTAFTGELNSLPGVVSSEGRYLALQNYVEKYKGIDNNNIDNVVNTIYGNAEDTPGIRNVSMMDTAQYNRTFRSLVYISNEQRELRVQKVDSEGNPLNGAEFKLYATEEDANNDQNAVAIGTTATVDGQEGMLIFRPQVPEDTTGYAKMEWANSENTDYFLKETKAPEGYHVNKTVIPVVVGIYSVYADAGDDKDGISVKAGVGKLMQTMTKYASDGEVNITLRDITAISQTQASGNFSINGWQSNPAQIGNESMPSVNLHYGLNNVIDYGLHDDDGGATTQPYFITDTGYLRTSVRQSDLSIEETSPARREDLGITDITSLFSLINIVVVTDDPQVGDLKITNTVMGNAANLEKDFTYTITLYDGGKNESYQYIDVDGTTTTMNHNATITIRHGQEITIKNLPKNTTYSIKENEANKDDYATTATDEKNNNIATVPIDGIASGTIGISDQQDVIYTTEANFVNERNKYGNLNVTKLVDGNASSETEEFEFIISLSETGDYDYEISNGGTPGTLTADNNKILLKHNQTLTIKNIPNGTTYTVTESNSKGYDSKVTEGNATGTISLANIDDTTIADTNVTFTNTKNEYGSLRISKTVNGNAPIDGDFTFTVTFMDETNTTVLTDEFAYEGTGVEDGKIHSGDTITLRNGQSIIITGIPIKTNYTVTETLVDGYKTYVNNSEEEKDTATGSITTNSTAVAAFTNTRDKFGDLIISKTVGGNAGDKTRPFEFTIKLEDKDGNPLTMSYTPLSVGVNPGQIVGTGKISLSDNQSIKFEQLPVGTKYTIVETPVAGYVTTVGDNKTNETSGNIIADNETTVNFLNTKDEYGSLKIAKTVEGNNASTTTDFGFTIRFYRKDNLTQTLPGNFHYKKYNGTEEIAEATIVSGTRIELRHNQSFVIDGLPAGTKYEITESSPSSYETKINGVESTNRIATGTIEFNKTSEVNYLNTRDEYGDLTISKNVTGNASNREDSFKFKIEFTRDNAILEGDYSVKAGLTTLPVSISNGDEFELKHGQSITIEDLPVRTKYTITEIDSKGYVASVGGKVTNEVTDDIVTSGRTVNFLNTKDEFGNLTISKVVAGNAKETVEEHKKFKFNVTLTDELGNTLAGTYNYIGNNGALNGTIASGGSIELEDGQSITIMGLPIKTKYTVEEDADSKEGFTVTSTNEEGIIEASVTKTAAFTNAINKFGDLKISKTVAGNAGDQNQYFEFTVSLTDKNNNVLLETYNYEGSKTGTIQNNGKVTLKHGESITIKNLPYGAKYKVIETESKGYIITSEGADGTIGDSTTSEAKFTNTKNEYGSLKISKVLAGNAPVDGDFTFKINFTRNNQSLEGNYTYKGSKTGTIKDGDTVILKGGQDITIEGLPVNTVYTVEETAVDGYVTTVNGNNTNKITDTITADAVKEANFVNTMDKYGSLTISKVVAGNAGDTTKEFEFIVSLKDKDGKSLTASYTGYKEGTIQDGKTISLKDASSITIENLPYGTKYKITEKEEIPGEYEIESTGDEGTIDNSTASATFTNTKNVYEGLTIQKIVSGNSGDKTKDFTFNITLKDGDENPVSETYNYVGSKEGTIEFKDGKGTIQLHSSQKITIEGLPNGTKYEVTEEEADQDGYATKSVNATGTIKEGMTEADNVVFTNTKDLYGTLEISKKVSGNSGEFDKAFTFIVTLTDTTGKAITENYHYTGSKTGTLTSGSEITLSHGEHITIEGLPVGTTYKVEEKEANQNRYVTTVTDDEGTIEDNKTSSVEFTNTRNLYGNLTVRKIVKGNAGELDRPFTFTITLKDKNGKPLTGTYDYVGSKEGTISDGETFTLSHGEHITIEGLPVGATYKVEEVKVDGYVVTSESEGNTIELNSTKEIIFINTKEIIYDTLKLSNTVGGNAGDQTKDFTFTILLTDSEGNLLTGTYHYTGSKEGTITSGESITLKHGESIVIEEIPAGTKYTIIEKEFNQDGYETTVDQTDGVLLGNNDSEVNFVNIKNIYPTDEEEIPNTGDSISTWISVFVLSLLGILSTLFVLYKNDRKVEE